MSSVIGIENFFSFLMHAAIGQFASGFAFHAMHKNSLFAVDNQISVRLSINPPSSTHPHIHCFMEEGMRERVEKNIQFSISQERKKNQNEICEADKVHCLYRLHVVVY